MRRTTLRMITRLIQAPTASKSWSQYLKSASQAVELAFLTIRLNQLPRASPEWCRWWGQQWYGAVHQGRPPGGGVETEKWKMKTTSPSGKGLWRNGHAIKKEQLFQRHEAVTPLRDCDLASSLKVQVVLSFSTFYLSVYSSQAPC